MPNIRIPYAKTFVEVDVPVENLRGVLESKAHHFKAEKSEEELVKKAMMSPVGSSRLKNMADGKQNIVIITSDHTRPVPSKITMPILLEEIRSGNPEASITILIATGFHRATTEEELLNRFGERIYHNEKIVVHDCQNEDELTYMGKLPSGGDLTLNRRAVEADLLISEGFIEPHFFAGFSGGRKSVLPGIAGHKTVLANHCAEFIASPNARTGVLKDNPMHKDMLYAAEKANLSCILNVVINSEKEIIEAFAGHPVEAHEKGCRLVEEMAMVKPVPADILITSNGGYPLDQNIYQTVKGMTAAEASAKPGAVIIIVSACNDGHGGESFYKTFLEAKSPGEVMESILGREMESTLPDQWESQILARILMKHEIILVTDQCDENLITNMHMKHAASLDEALKMAFSMKGKNAGVTVIPDGVGVIVKLEEL
ncbi:MAG: nickel-dependent lactate racemase [Tindallia sp. MSAO_Bac2]|nr:MAG: nickel-dependent lactate racemase [Tindallia sp. MSAO_Bac2]